MEITLKRGDIVVCALSGDFGKPRPAVIVQSDLFNPTHLSITICPITTHLIEAPLFRISILPTTLNGLKKTSQIMIDKITTLHREKIKQKIGSITSSQNKHLIQAIRTWLHCHSE